MYNREKLLAIPALKLDSVAMSEIQFERYVHYLNTFIDQFPTMEEDLRDSMDAGDFGELTKNLDNLGEALKKLYAPELALECRLQAAALAGSGGAGSDELESFVENMLLSVSALSIDIQMASYRGAHRKGKPPRPAAPPKSEHIPMPASAAARSDLPLILAVDDAVMFLNTLKKLLADAPYDLFCAQSCDEAFDFLQNNRPDMFLLDIEMPGMDGYTLARRIKNSGQRAPVIFITANSAREYVDKAVEVGAVGLIMKPVRKTQLLAKIQEFI